ncbi:hypothetical protein FACUT_395 [Fusarium acutatum]|uniref:Uncharacterized protein n=1 Tax=Fusarium acutatum TaxID=78861 RepID=A0A8H4K6R3_9HYPO|nr:hypothetical protein FACUT_395 [Fusarium acutatum]
MAPSSRSSSETSDYDPFEEHTGNIEAKPGQSAQNAIGAAENAFHLATLVQKFIDAGNDPELCQQARSVLTTMGGCEGLCISIDTIKAEHAPEPGPYHPGRVIWEAHHSLESTRNAAKSVDHNTNPIDHTKPRSARKRPATEVAGYDSDEDILALFDSPPRG